jgi:eukaryotic-like serine/threonine-protein kinase
MATSAPPPGGAEADSAGSFGGPKPGSAQHEEHGTARPLPAAVAAEKADTAIPAQLGGYRIISKLGEGGMGSVYRARQISLDRDVAVKVMNPQWAKDPGFVSRFTREAYAAAQLVHHHVVQIHDIGVQGIHNYFSMEFVNGKTLAGLLHKEGKVDPEAAVGYALQAARGLKFAHDMGMVHRDVKPENLLMNDQGIVKVADLGLVKTPGLVESGPVPQSQKLAEAASAHQTMANAAMGTPAYMAPEQSMDAAHVDQRADIYSLGCTLYHLVTGRPPFDGKTAVEVISKHQTDPVTPPEVIVRRVPKVLSTILMKMMAKQPEDRYQTMDQVIKAMEEYLGVESSGPFTPREEHANTLEESVQRFNTSVRAKQRKQLIWGFYGASTLMVIVLSLLKEPMWAGGFVGLLVLSTLAYIVVTGLTQKTHLFTRLRHLVLGAAIGDWFMGLLGFGLALVALWVVGWFWAWFGFAVVAVGLAIGLHMTWDKMTRADQGEPVDRVREMLRSMRLKGLDEEALHQFVCKYSGLHWEAFYEELFGYEDKLVARQRWGRGEQGKARPKYGAWRDMMIAWMESRLAQRKQERERRVLEKVERARLKSEGLSNKDAQAKAEAAADAFVDKAAEVRSVAEQRSQQTMAPTAAAASAPAKPAKAMAGAATVKQMTELDQSAADRARSRKRANASRGGVLGLMFGARTRFVLGVLLVGGCLLWIKQNDLVKPERIKQWISQSYEKARAGGFKSVNDIKAIGQSASGAVSTNKEVQPLKLPVLPQSVTSVFNGFSPGLAGLVLVASVIFPGLTLGVLLLPAAFIAVFGAKLGVPGIGPISPQGMALLIAGTLTVLGWFVRKRG